MTKNIATNVTANGDTTEVPVVAGQYMLAVGGTFDGASVAIKISVGAATGVPITGAVYTAPGAEIIWLPSCTMYMTVSSAGASTDISLAIAKVVTDVN